MGARIKYRPRLPLWGHQKEAVKRLWRIGSALLWWDVGTGKTKTTLDYLFARHIAGQVNKVVIVCPLSVVGVWENEIAANSPEGLQVHVDSRNEWPTLSKLPSALRTNREGLHIVIITYSALNNYVQALAGWKPDAVVYDESQWLRNYSAIRTRRALFLSRHTTYVLCLSGTPAPNGHIDVYYQIKMIHPNILPPTLEGFKRKYCVMGGYMGRDIVDYRNEKELAKRISRVTLRASKDMLDLPPTLDQTIPVRLKPATRNVYETLRKDLVLEIQGHDIITPNHLVLMLRLSEITGGFLAGEPVGRKEKIKALGELIADRTDKLVIWARFRKELEAIEGLATRLGMSYNTISGEISGQQRTEAIRRFQHEEDPQILICQIAAIGVGVTLTAANTAIFYSLDYSSEHYEQAKGRTHRGGQTKTCHYLHLTAQNTIDESVLTAVQRKMSRQQLLAHVVEENL